MIEWMLVLVDFGCMVFLVKSIMEHIYFVREVQPQIDALIERAERFEARGEAEAEAEKRNEVRARLPELKEALRATGRETEETCASARGHAVRTTGKPGEPAAFQAGRERRPSSGRRPQRRRCGRKLISIEVSVKGNLRDDDIWCV